MCTQSASPVTRIDTDILGQDLWSLKLFWKNLEHKEAESWDHLSPPPPPTPGRILLLGRKGRLVRGMPIITDYKWPLHLQAGNTQLGFPRIT